MLPRNVEYTKEASGSVNLANPAKDGTVKTTEVDWKVQRK
jgi:hypothetical protein